MAKGLEVEASILTDQDPCKVTVKLPLIINNLHNLKMRLLLTAKFHGRVNRSRDREENEILSVSEVLGYIH